MYLLLNAASYDGEIWHAHPVPIMCRTCAGFYVYRGRRYENNDIFKQQSPAIADKPARRESLLKFAPIRRVYNVVADNTGLSSFV